MIVRAACTSPAEMHKAAAALAGLLRGGELLALAGPLGAGKTVFVRGLASALGAQGDDVASPTFVLVREYVGRLRVVHLDAYRLSDAAELDALGFDELRSDDAIVAVEWADRTPERIDRDAWWLTFTYGADPSTRLVEARIPAHLADRAAGLELGGWTVERPRAAPA